MDILLLSRRYPRIRTCAHAQICFERTQLSPGAAVRLASGDAAGRCAAARSRLTRSIIVWDATTPTAIATCADKRLKSRPVCALAWLVSQVH